MASSPFNLKISRLILSKATSTLVRPVRQANLSFWFGKSLTPQVKARKIENINTCRRPEPPNLKLCIGCPSQCVYKKKKAACKSNGRFFTFLRSSRKKPQVGNYIAPKQKKSLINRLFGLKTIKSNSSQSANKKDESSKDPRLRDPRYRNTPGDVLVFAEPSRCIMRPSFELQPAPGPSYKLPKEVLYKIMNDAFEKKQSVCAFEDTKDSKQSKNSVILPKESKIPFAEMRASQKIKSSFNCQRGIRAEDVIKPSCKEFTVCNMLLRSLRLLPKCEGDQNEIESNKRIYKTALSSCSARNRL